ncbi:MAG: VanZ family protein [Williamsia sp.]|nr:VanZ family protein [Williamsia sp.]
MKIIFRTPYLALAWTIVIQVLLCLPGSALPDEGSFIPNIDKIVHTVLFGGFVAFWCLYADRKNYTIKKEAAIFFAIYLLACINGIGLEYVQKYYIPNRSFDQGDIIVDIISASISYGLCNVYLLAEPSSLKA